MTEFSMEPPLTEITLKVAAEGDKKIWVYEDHNTVIQMTTGAEDRSDALVTFSRVLGIGNPGTPFSTRPSNVMNVRKLDA